ncbi:MAG: serine/threonine protein kinase [Pontiellaceae bacterium]|nr:serine/threonine protein kinase [Pontiellaceae bacterium]MBN2786442.1 serine/threonine protein kinase [Pontiellaceae bacterium]
MKKDEQQSGSLSGQADEIFLAALEFECTEEQRSYVKGACGSNADLLREVELLLDSLEHSKGFFEDSSPARITAAEISRTLTELPAFYENLKSSLPDDGEVGKQIGPYKLLQKIGEGGVGNVYLAEQEKPVRRRVAFKIIKRGMDTKSVIARFEIERQALAMMEHPNIAHVIDAGETELGRPFFVMELVHGVRITTFCNENQLGIRDRLSLFVQVCHGIQHAHQKGIIHRDIKPSNVLVRLHDGVPMPKVIDFGIAKAALDDAVSGEADFTRVEPFVGTPAYMSPEQSQPGVDVDTRTDIYSLGVMLYELLTGAPPFDQKELMQSGYDGMRRVLLETDPARPSMRLSHLDESARREVAEKCGAEVRYLQAALHGDLDWIVMKALEKDRSRRYETVDALAMDIERFLHNEPVLARPPSRRYRFRKMVSRNRTAFISGTAIGVLLLAWMASSSLLLVREQKLRVAAEDRERIAQAAFLIGAGNLEEADRLAGQVEALTPSLEAESVLRTLGEWHALHGRWEDSAERFRLLIKVDIKDSSWAITDDLLMAGPILIEQGDVAGYEIFRQAAVEKYHDTTAWVFAERTLKVSMLMPADDSLLQQIEPLSELVASGSGGEVAGNGMSAWGGIALSLVSLRTGDMAGAIRWSRWSSDCPDYNPSRTAISHAIHAMASVEAGDMNSARHELELGQQLVDAVFSRSLVRGSATEGFWYDWVYARILMREAESYIR